MPRRFALCLNGDGVWTGGVNYIATVCNTLLENPDLGWEPVVLCSSRAPAVLLERFRALLGDRLVADPFLGQGRRAGLLGAVTFGVNQSISALCRAHRVDVIMEAADFFGWRFPVPCLAWVPDFQDRHLPHLFSRGGLLRKVIGLRLQLAAGRTVLLSSEDARADCEHFYPASRSRTAVARFAVRPPLAPGESDPQVAGRHGLPERFIYLPNQFWVHKNHARAIDAVRLLRAQGVDIVVAASGNPNEPRHAGHYSRLVDAVAAAGIGANWRFLGNIPYGDVAQLMRAGVAVLNPSLFEGWSTTIEEAKSLGARLVVSDLRVHREQLGDQAEFFDPNDAAAMAASLRKVWSEYIEPVPVADREAAAAAADRRIREFAQQLTAACNRAIGAS